jgi:hypothetical protein
MNHAFNFRRGVALAAALTLATACDNGKDTDTDGETDEVELDTGADTDEGEDYLDIDSMLILSQFAYDPALDVARPVTNGANEVPVLVDFIFASAAWDGTFTDDEEFCIVEYVFTGNANRAPWAGSSPVEPPVEDTDAEDTDAEDTDAEDTDAPVDTETEEEPEVLEPLTENIAFGFDLPANWTASFTDCNEKLDPVAWPDMAADIQQFDWSIGLGKAMDPDYRAQLASGGISASQLAELGGSGLAGDFGLAYDPTGYLDVGLVFAYEVDDEFALKVTSANEGISIPAADMYSDGRVARGHYTVQIALPLTALEQLLP